MRQVCGTFGFDLHTFKGHQHFTLLLPMTTILDITVRRHHFDFCLKSDMTLSDVFWRCIHASANSIGFLLDVRIYSSYSTALEVAPVGNVISNEDEAITFDFVMHTLMYDQTVKRYVDAEIPRTMKFRRSEIEEFIGKLSSNGTLAGAVSNYLKALEEPEFFLISLYKAYELIRSSGALSKTAAKKFTRVANDPGIHGSRHSSNRIKASRSLMLGERKFCQEIIRRSIFQYANNL